MRWRDRELSTLLDEVVRVVRAIRAERRALCPVMGLDHLDRGLALGVSPGSRSVNDQAAR